MTEHAISVSEQWAYKVVREKGHQKSWAPKPSFPNDDIYSVHLLDLWSILN